MKHPECKAIVEDAARADNEAAAAARMGCEGVGLAKCPTIPLRGASSKASSCAR